MDLDGASKKAESMTYAPFTPTAGTWHSCNPAALEEISLYC